MAVFLVEGVVLMYLGLAYWIFHVEGQTVETVPPLRVVVGV